MKEKPQFNSQEIVSTFRNTGELPKEIRNIIEEYILSLAMGRAFGSGFGISSNLVKDLMLLLGLDNSRQGSEVFHTLATLYDMQHSNNAGDPYARMINVNAPYLYAESIQQHMVKALSRGVSQVVQLGCLGQESYAQMQSLATVNGLQLQVWDKEKVSGVPETSYQNLDFTSPNSRVTFYQGVTLFIGENILRPNQISKEERAEFAKNILAAVAARGTVILYDWSESTLKDLSSAIDVALIRSESRHTLSNYITPVFATSALGFNLILKGASLSQYPQNPSTHSIHYCLVLEKKLETA